MGLESENQNEAIERLLDRLDRQSWSGPSAPVDSTSAPCSGQEVHEVAKFLQEQSQSELSHALRSERRSESIAVPVQIGPFRIEKLLGRGGFGDVFLARREANGQSFALKWLHAERSKSRISFFREWALSSQLRHPSLVSSFEMGECEGRPYYTMEYVEGRSLAEQISRQKDPAHAMPTSEYLDLISSVMLQVAQGLSALHRNGIFHRDLKPGNVLIDRSGQAKISDLGLIAQEASWEREHAVGTYPYTSPEQARGAAASESSDIFSFGSTFYEALCLRRAFSGKDRKEILKAIRSTAPISPRQLQSNISPKIEAIVLRCLVKDPRRRFRSAEELAETLHLAISGSDARGGNSRWRHRPILTLGGATLCAWIASVVFSGETKPAHAEQVKLEIPTSIQSEEKRESNPGSEEVFRPQFYYPDPIASVALPENSSEQSKTQAPSPADQKEEFPRSKAAERTRRDYPSLLAPALVESNLDYSAKMDRSHVERTYPNGAIARIHIAEQSAQKTHFLLNALSIRNLPICSRFDPTWPTQKREQVLTCLDQIAGLSVQNPFYDSIEQELISYRRLLDQGKILILDAGYSHRSNGKSLESKTKELRFLAALATLIWKPGDSLYLKPDTLVLNQENCLQWPSKLGIPLDKSYVLDNKNNLLKRRFENGSISVSLAAIQSGDWSEAAVVEWR